MIYEIILVILIMSTNYFTYKLGRIDERILNTNRNKIILDHYNNLLEKYNNKVGE